MSAKKRSATSEKELKSTVKKLRSKLERTEAKKQEWKKKAGELEKSAAKSQTKVKKLSKRLDAARAAGEQEPAATSEQAPLEDLDLGQVDQTGQVDQVEQVNQVEPEADEAATEPADSPDSSWTVVQLRAEARSRGLTGLSNKSKAQLLDALN